VISAHGISIAVPRGWDARIEQRRDDPILAPPSLRLEGERIARSGTPNPVAHLANYPLPARRGDYGSGAVETMSSRGVFLALVEFDVEAATTAAFARSGLPKVRLSDVHADAQQRLVQGHCGAQWFFNTNGRAFSLFVVLGSWVMRRTLVDTVNRVIPTITIGSRPG
jgi:hypothetical protein